MKDTELRELLDSRTNQKGKEVVFFDWVPTNRNDERLDNQVREMKRCHDERIPVIVFDRYSSMTDDEVIFLHKKTKPILLEPSVVTRPGFIFMPYWVHFKEYKCSDFQDNRRFQTGYKGDKFTTDLESSILSVIKDKLIVGLDVKLPQDKYDVLKSVVCIDRFEYTDLDTMILTGTKEDYNRGRLPDIRSLLEFGVVPCLHHHHKWLHSMFRHFVVYSHDDIRWLAKLYKNCGIGFLEDMQKNILEYLPEMEAGNWVDSLLDKAEKL